MNECQCPDHPGHKAAYEECHRCGKPLCGDCTLPNYNIDTGKYVFGGSVCVTCNSEVMSILRSRGIKPTIDFDEPFEEELA